MLIVLLFHTECTPVRPSSPPARPLISVAAHIISPQDVKDKCEPLVHDYAKLTCSPVPVRFRWIIGFLFVFGLKQSFLSLGWLPEVGVCGWVLLQGLRASVLINREVT